MDNKRIKRWLLSDYAIFMAIILLMISALLLAIGKNIYANQFSIYSYFSIVMGILLKFFELLNISPGWTSSVFTGKRISILKRIATSHYFSIVVFAAISLLIIQQFDGKYIFGLDMIFPIKKLFYYYFYGFATNEWGGYTYLIAIAKSEILEEWFLERIYLFLIIFLSGTSMFFLIDSKSLASKYFAGILYSINPFVYIRFLIGHWVLLLAYSILPFSIKYFINFLENPNRKNLIKTIFLTFICGSLSSHVTILLFIIYLIILIFKFYHAKNDRRKKMENAGQMISYLIIFIISFALLNAYWFLPLISDKESIISNIGDEDFEVFSPDISNISDFFNIISMHGFWRDNYVYSRNFIPYWQIFAIFILSLPVIGFLSCYKDEKTGIYVKAFAAIAIAGFVFIAGINGPFQDFFRILLKGMRDSYKFIALLALSYSYLGARAISGISLLKGNHKKIFKQVIIFLALIIPLFYSFTFFNGFAGQIKPTDYPEDWYEVNELLNKDKNDFKVLFFPWHQYISFKWINNSDKRILNPAGTFFDKEIISGKNIEIGGIRRQDHSPDQLFIDSLLKNKYSIKNFGEYVSVLNARYILLAKEADYEVYSFLFKQKDLKLIKETEHLYVFKNKKTTSKIFQTDNINNFNSENIPVDYEIISQVRYKLKGELSRKYLVFTEPYSEYWELDGKKPLKAYGTVNAYENSGKEIVFERFYRINLPGYIISFISFVGLVIMYFKPHHQT